MSNNKTLYLVRHAKSSWSDPGLADRDRPLNARGEHNAPLMAERLAHNIRQCDGQFPRPDHIITSPAVRALTTARAIIHAIQYPESRLIQEERLYFQGAQAMLDVISETPEACDTLMLVAHNPDLTDLHNRLVTLTLDQMPTCAIVTIHFDVSQWHQLANRIGSLVDFDYPKRTIDLAATQPALHRTHAGEF